jgi:DNA polymerase III delta prime subunit
MFFTDFVPETLDDFVINRDIADYIQRNKGLVNTIIYGANGVGKFTLARMMVKNSLTFGKINTKPGVSNDNNINIGNFHYELFVSQYNYKDKNSFVKTIDDFSDSVNVSTGCSNIIIIKNADLLSRDNILTIKKYTERSDKFVTFILTMKSINKYRSNLNGFFMVRVPTATKEVISDFISSKINTGYEDEMRKIINNNRCNLKSIFIDLEILLLNQGTVKIKNETNKFVKKIVNAIFNFNYVDVRNNIYELSTKNIEKCDILRLILKKIISCELKDEIRFKIISLAGKYSARMADCNKEIIQLEAFCFECMAVFVIK